MKLTINFENESGAVYGRVVDCRVAEGVVYVEFDNKTARIFPLRRIHDIWSGPDEEAPK